MNTFITKRQRGFTAIELLITLLIGAMLFSIVISAFVSFRKHRALIADTDNIVVMIKEARNLSTVSKNASTYGIHFTSTTTTSFTGASYATTSSSNQVYYLNGAVTLDATLPGGSDIIFNRVTGDTNLSAAATIVLSAGTTASTTITVYKTGTVERSR